MNTINQKTTVIAARNSGTGYAAAKPCKEEGATVIITCRNPNKPGLS